MAKNQTIFVCSNCGNESPKWLGKCPACGNWNTYYEEKVYKDKTTLEKVRVGTQVTKLKDVGTEEAKARVKTGYEELDRVLGGGIVPRFTNIIRSVSHGIRKININFTNL